MPSFQPLTSANAAYLKEVAQARCGFLTQLAWSPDGQTLAVSHGGGISLWQRSFGAKPTVSFQPHDGPVKSLAFSNDGYVLATASADSTVRLCVIPTGVTFNVMRGHEGSVEDVAFSPDGALLASCSTDGTVRVLDMRETARRDVLKGHEDEVTAIGFGMGMVISASRDTTIRLWNGTTEQAVLRGHTNWIRDIAVSPGGMVVASASRDGTVRLWDVTSREPIGVLEQAGDSRAVAFSPNGRLMATDDEGIVHVWDVVERTRLATLKAHTKPVLSLAFHPNGALLASGSGDGTIRLWGVTV